MPDQLRDLAAVAAMVEVEEVDDSTPVGKVAEEPTKVKESKESGDDAKSASPEVAPSVRNRHTTRHHHEHPLPQKMKQQQDCPPTIASAHPITQRAHHPLPTTL